MKINKYYLLSCAVFVFVGCILPDSHKFHVFITSLSFSVVLFLAIQVFKLNKASNDAADADNLLYNNLTDDLSAVNNNVQTLDLNIKILVKQINKINNKIKKLEQDAEKKEREYRKSTEKQRVVRSHQSDSSSKESQILRTTDGQRKKDI